MIVEFHIVAADGIGKPNPGIRDAVAIGDYQPVQAAAEYELAARQLGHKRLDRLEHVDHAGSAPVDRGPFLIDVMRHDANFALRLRPLQKLRQQQPRIAVDGRARGPCGQRNGPAQGSADRGDAAIGIDFILETGQTSAPHHVFTPRPIQDTPGPDKDFPIPIQLGKRRMGARNPLDQPRRKRIAYVGHRHPFCCNRWHQPGPPGQGTFTGHRKDRKEEGPSSFPSSFAAFALKSLFPSPFAVFLLYFRLAWKCSITGSTPGY